MIRRPPRSTLSSSSAASDVYKRQIQSSASVRTGTHPAFGVGVRARGPRWDFQDLHTRCGEHVIEGLSELGVPVADQEPEPAGTILEVDQEVACLLGHPRPGGLGGNPGQVYPPGLDLYHEEH